MLSQLLTISHSLVSVLSNRRLDRQRMMRSLELSSGRKSVTFITLLVSPEG